jgi:hypothetical protein
MARLDSAQSWRLREKRTRRGVNMTGRDRVRRGKDSREAGGGRGVLYVEMVDVGSCGRARGA